MKTLLTTAVSLGVLLFAWRAGAQGDAPSSTVPPLPAPTPPQAATCRLGEHAGIDDTDAATAAQLVCSELARQGAPSDAHYRVGLGKLGAVIILSVAREGDAPGSTADAREVRLQGIEEATIATPRIVDALIHGTQVVDADANRAPVRPGSKVHFALGLVGQFAPFDRSAAPAPGAEFELLVDLAPVEVLGNVRFGGDSSDQSVGVVFFDFSMGARYFPSESDFSPYFGGGLAWSYFNLTDNVRNDFDGNRTGLGLYGEAGVEFLHSHHTRLSVGARVDVPFYSLANDRNENEVTTSSGPQPTPSPSTLYYVPVSLELRLTL